MQLLRGEDLFFVSLESEEEPEVVKQKLYQGVLILIVEKNICKITLFW